MATRRVYCDKTESCWYPERWNCHMWLSRRKQILPWAGKSELWSMHWCSVIYRTGWYHWRASTLLDDLLIKITDQIRKPTLLYRHWAKRGMLLFSWHIRKFADFSICISQSQERIIVNSFWLCIQDPLLVSVIPVLTPPQSSTVRIMHCAVRLQLGNPWLAHLHYDLFTLFCLFT